MQIHLRVQHWVVWWFYVGVVCGAIALTIILGHHFTGAQDRLLLLIGAAHWLLGGIVCWAFQGVRVESRPPAAPPAQSPPKAGVEKEWHSPSDFLLPGGRQSMLPWRH
jgi:hypothetical protein